MSASIPRFSFCVVLIASLAGCGSSNKSGTCVTDCGGNSTVVTYTFTGGTPVALATKIGTGAFTQATLASGKLSISVPSGTTNYSVAWVCPPDTSSNPPQNDERVIQASVQDGTSFSWYCSDANVTKGTATVQVNASAISGGTWVDAWGSVGVNGAAIGLPWSNSTLNLSGEMITGTYDVFVTVSDANDNLLAVKILHDQTIPGALNGGNPVVFAASDAVSSQPLTVNNIPAGFSPSLALVNYETATYGDSLELNIGLNGLRQYTALPSAAMQSGDYYFFLVGAYGSTTPNLNESVGAEMTSTSSGPQTITLPAPWSYAGPTPAALPTFNFSYTGFSGMANVEQGAGVQWDQGTTSTQSIQMSATASYQNGATSMTIPDLSGLTGFLAPAPSGTPISWSASVYQGWPLLSYSTNGTLSVVTDSGTYTEP
ncbi:MAG: hypothetical protein ABSC48_12565 [Terracidiphilus sp.]